MTTKHPVGRPRLHTGPCRGSTKKTPCAGEVIAWGLCRRHYNCLRVNGDLKVRPVGRPPMDPDSRPRCGADISPRCTSIATSLGLCKLHYEHQRRPRYPLKPIQRRLP